MILEMELKAKANQMKKILVAFLFLLSACSNPGDLTGTWQVKKFSRWSKGIAMLHGWYLEVNDKLLINADSSWRLEGSCEVFQGKTLLIKSDSLYLFPDTCWGRANVALNASQDELSGRFLAYKIRNRCIEKRSEGFFQEVGRHDSLVKHKFIILEKLERTK